MKTTGTMLALIWFGLGWLVTVVLLVVGWLCGHRSRK
jgi:hypothetical protein